MSWVYKATAQKIKEMVTSSLVKEHLGIGDNQQDITFPELVVEFLKGNPHWSDSTRHIYTNVLKAQLAGKPLPENPTS